MTEGQDPNALIKNLPASPGVYRFLDAAGRVRTSRRRDRARIAAKGSVFN